MTIDIVLFILRVVSILALIGFLAALFMVIWRDYQSAANQARASKRAFGQIIALTQIDGSYLPTGEVYPLLPITTIGRSPTNSIIVKDSFASGEHAILALRNNQWWLEDRNSRNGTLLNDERIGSPVIITDSDIISIGSISFRIELEQ